MLHPHPHLIFASTFKIDHRIGRLIMINGADQRIFYILNLRAIQQLHRFGLDKGRAGRHPHQF